MHYNFSFEVSAVIFMGIILTYFMRKKQYYMLTSKVFFAFLISSFADSIFNVISCVLIYYTQEIPVILNIIVATIFFLLQGVDVYFFFLYTCFVCRRDTGISRWGLGIFTIPFIVYMMFAFTSPFSGFCFFFNDSKQYCQGIGASTGYQYIYLYIVISFALAIIYIRRLTKRDLIVIFTYCLVFLSAIAIQFEFRSLLLTGFARAIVILIMYITMENPNDFIDRKTGILNNIAFHMTIRDRTKSRKPFTVIQIDINKYRYINSAFGYDNGDKLLIEVADFLEKCGSKEQAFRSNQDEFIIIVDGNDKNYIQHKIDIITERFDRPWYFSQYETYMKASIVVIEYPTYFSEVYELNYISKYLMDKIKCDEESNIIFASTELLQDYHRKEKIEQALRMAIDNKTLQVYYQPINTHNHGQVVALEALVRLFDDELGMIPPDEFIGMAEKNGLIISLGDYVFEEVCIFIEQCLQMNTISRFERVQVNLSIVQCMQLDLADKFIAVIDRYNVPANMINLEITELATLNSSKILLNNMNKLIDKGVTFSLDDFGTGNSNFSYLIQFPFTQIKFDKSMIWSYFVNESARIIMENEFKTLHRLGKKIIAEGIETQEQYDTLKQIEIDYFQGYLFSRPIPKDQCLEYLKLT